MKYEIIRYDGEDIIVNSVGTIEPTEISEDKVIFFFNDERITFSRDPIHMSLYYSHPLDGGQFFTVTEEAWTSHLASKNSSESPKLSSKVLERFPDLNS